MDVTLSNCYSIFLQVSPHLSLQKPTPNESLNSALSVLNIVSHARLNPFEEMAKILYRPPMSKNGYYAQLFCFFISPQYIKFFNKIYLNHLFSKIMKLPLLLFFLMIQSIWTFDCSSVANQEYCAQLGGCSWDPILQCQGNFSLSCSASKCYYIDSSSLENNSDGTAQYPFQSLSDGLKKLSSSDGNLIIINLQENTTVDITQTLSVSTNITIL